MWFTKLSSDHPKDVSTPRFSLAPESRAGTPCHATDLFTRHNEAMSLRLLFKSLPLVDVTARMTTDVEIPTVIEFAVDMRDRIGGVEPCALQTNHLGETAPGVGPEFVLNLAPGSLPSFALRFPERGLTVRVYRRHIAVSWTGAADFPIDTERVPRQPEDYPGYEAGIRPVLSFVLDAMTELLGPFSVSVANISYASDFALDEGESVFDYLSLADPGTLAFTSPTMTIEVSARKSDGTDLRASFRQAEGRAWVQTAAGAYVNAPALADGLEALNEVHTLLGSQFVEMLTDKARNKWRMVER